MRRFLLSVAALTVGCLLTMPAADADLAVSRATLPNGMRVIVVRDPLAPVVTTMLNYEVGSDEQTVNGEAHALEHMMFRGSSTLSSAQLMDTMSLTGGAFDADTQNAVTQYYFTVPSQYLDIALRLERSRATGLSLEQSQWEQERGAITQEVTQDNSNAIQRLFRNTAERMLAGTPYAKNGLGTVYDFAHTVNAPLLRGFYDRWYHPNNAVYVIAGDVDGPSTIARVKALFGTIPKATLPARGSISLRPFTSKIFRDQSDLPYTLVFLGYRFPGYDSRDYAASQIAGDILNSQRGNLFGLVAGGKALYTGFESETFRKTGIGLAIGVVPVSVKPEDIDSEVRGVIAAYLKTGVPDALVDAEKAREVSQLEFSANSIEGLAAEWSEAVAVQGIDSPDAMKAAYERVTTADVNRVLRTYLTNDHVIAAYAVPKNAGAATGGSGGPAKEDVMVPPSKHEPLPSWASSLLSNLSVPAKTLSPTSMTLSNGIRLIVQPESISNTVVVAGHIDNNADVEEPADRRGVGDVTSAMFPFGTTTYNRLAFQEQLDAISANVSAGTDFSVSVLSKYFDRGVALLADDELHPAFSAPSFEIVKGQTVGELRGEMTAPDHLADVALAKALYPPGDPAQQFATPDSVGSVTLDDVKAWYAKAYRPDLTTVVVIGDITPEAARATFEKYFGGWSATGPKPQTEPQPVPLNTASNINVPAQGRVQSDVRLVELIDLKRTDPDWAPLQVANQALTGGFYSSILYHDVREVHGYAYAVSSSVKTGRVRSSFAIGYGSDPQNVVPAQRLIVSDLNRLLSAPMGDTDLTRAKALLIGQIPIAQDSFDGVGSMFLHYSELDLPLDQYEIDAKNYLGTSAQTIRAAMNAHIRPDGFVRIVTGPAPQ